MRSPLFSKPIVGRLLTGAGQIEVADAGKRAFEQACALLQQGQTVVIYPEGRLNPEHENLKAKSGAVRISIATGAPIIPLGIYVQPEHIKDMRQFMGGRISRGCWQVSGCCHLRFGPPWEPALPRQNPAELHHETQKLMEHIYSLVAEIRKESACESHTSLNPIPQW